MRTELCTYGRTDGQTDRQVKKVGRLADGRTNI